MTTRNDALFTARLIAQHRVDSVSTADARLISSELLAAHLELCRALEAEKALAKDNAELRAMKRTGLIEPGRRCAHGVLTEFRNSCFGCSTEGAKK